MTSCKGNFIKTLVFLSFSFYRVGEVFIWNSAQLRYKIWESRKKLEYVISSEIFRWNQEIFTDHLYLLEYKLYDKTLRKKMHCCRAKETYQLLWGYWVSTIQGFQTLYPRSDDSIIVIRKTQDAPNHREIDRGLKLF